MSHAASHDEPRASAAHDPETHIDAEGARIGMWLFLATELVIFGCLFLIYGVTLTKYRTDFLTLSGELNQFMGATNTVFLLTSSLTMVLAIAAIRKGRKDHSLLLLWATIGFALLFFVVKYFEWSAKFHHGIWPSSPAVTAMGQGALMFYALYFCMTGLHGFHVLGGVVALAIMVRSVQKERTTAGNYVVLENVGLYWHLVDLIWIYLFPLFYLIA